MYACSYKWSNDWINLSDLKRVLEKAAPYIKSYYPKGYSRVGVNDGLHFTGGEPFLNYKLLLKAVELAHEMEIPATFVETNCYWCSGDEVVYERFKELREAGLHGVLVSVNPFLVEHVPFEYIERAVRIGREIFGENLMVYHELFYDQLRILGLKGKLRLEEYLDRMKVVDPRSLVAGLSYPSIFPMGRACYKLSSLYVKRRAEVFLHGDCSMELLRRWHNHVDCYCNYIPGYCAGLTLGDARKLDVLCSEGLELEDYPVLKALITDFNELYMLALEHGYRELKEGYISRCHLCLDIRRYLALEVGGFKELEPREFYLHLSVEEQG